MTDWKPAGAWHGGTVTAVGYSPHFVNDGLALAATRAGLYKTTDRGTSWSRVLLGSTDLGIVALAIASAASEQPNTIFVSTESGRLYRSDDNATRWEEVSTWAGLGLITAIALSPAYHADRSLFVATPNGVYRSEDDGNLWEEASFGLLDVDVLFLTCAPDFAESNVLWAGTALGGLYRSRNRALAWRETGVGLPDTAIQCMAIGKVHAGDGGETQLLFVGTESDGVYSSTDQGGEWIPCNGGLDRGDGSGSSVNALVIDESGNSSNEPRLIAGTNAGLYFGTAQELVAGGEWTAASNGDLLAFDLAVAPDGSTLAATLFEGLWQASDGGVSWQPTATNLAAHIPPIIYQAASTRFALDLDGVAAYSHNGEPWIPLLIADGPQAISALAVGERMVGDETMPVLYAIADDQLWCSSPDFQQWDAVALPTTNVMNLALSTSEQDDQGEKSDLLLLADEMGGFCVGRLPHGAHLSELTWQITVLPRSGETILQMVVSPHSTANESASDRIIRVISTHPNDEGNYVVTLWESADPGQGWAEMATLETELPSVLAAQPQDDPDTFFLATSYRVVKFYRDAATGELMAEQHFFANDLQVTALWVSPHFATDQTIWAATTVGLFRSVDGNASWQQHADLPAGLPIVGCWPPTASTSITVMTLGGEVWELDLV